MVDDITQLALVKWIQEQPRKDLKPREALTLFALSKWINSDLEMWPSIDHIADAACSSSTTVEEALKGLVSKGVLRKELYRRSEWGTCIYILSVDISAFAVSPTGQTPMIGTSVGTSPEYRGQETIIDSNSIKEQHTKEQHIDNMILSPSIGDSPQAIRNEKLTRRASQVNALAEDLSGLLADELSDIHPERRKYRSRNVRAWIPEMVYLIGESMDLMSGLMDDWDIITDIFRLAVEKSITDDRIGFEYVSKLCEPPGLLKTHFPRLVAEARTELQPETETPVASTVKSYAHVDPAVGKRESQRMLAEFQAAATEAYECEVSECESPKIRRLYENRGLKTYTAHRIPEGGSGNV